MAIPEALGTMDEVHYYQGIIVAEASVTLGLYVILKIIHYLKWGADEEMNMEKAPQAEINGSGAE